MLITGVDSGEKTGWAQAQNGLIFDCGLVLVKPDQPLGAIPMSRGGLVLVEKPIIRQTGKRPADQNDMITLGIKVGRYVETYLVLGNEVQTIRPTDWKGGVPKDIQNRRDEEALSTEERLIVSRIMAGIPESYRNNVWDGIGITLWAARKKKERR